MAGGDRSVKSHFIYVCTTCASVWQDGKRQGVSGGEKLLAQLTGDAARFEVTQSYQIRPVACMSACDRACVVGFAAEQKFTYLFGDLARESENLPQVSEAIFACAELYLQSKTGNLAWQSRPPLLKSGILAKVPPLVELEQVLAS
ncbi:MAG: DUF1636 domain-containing protein [Pseudanabaenaceae cyanobacterium bins.68]|nr:DUF1636 domain-containing protein [Pseudanabaenaceae cyanobacterium bins.68]